MELVSPPPSDFCELLLRRGLTVPQEPPGDPRVLEDPAPARKPAPPGASRRS
jgi:hypothetical protein